MFKQLQQGIALFALAALFHAGTAQGQQLSLADLQSKLTASWICTVEGEKRQRVLVVDAVAQKGEGAFLMTGTFNFTDGKPTAFKAGEILTSSGSTKVTYTSGADSVFTGSLQADGVISGTVTYKNGQVKNFKLEKGAAVAAAAPAAAAFTEFDGKWAGPAAPVSINCSAGNYDLTVTGGRVSGTVVFNTTRGAATSTVIGHVRPDKTMELALKRQVDFGRNTRFTMTLDGDQFKGRDTGTGACTYDVTLKKG